MMFGDSKYIDGETIEEFRSTGLAHIFAVSGLHIGVLAAALVFLLNLLRANKWVKFFVIFTILTLYATICEFSPSVLRASIMFLCYLLADIFGRKKDRLSIMCFAAILILIINPLAFFEISFQMSFGAIFGIILFADYFKRKLNFLPDWISSSVALSLSVNITLLPLMLYYFGYVSMVFIFVNLILLPFISLLYILALLTTILGLLVPYLHYLTLIVSYLMELAIWGNSLFVNLTITGLEFKIGLAVVILYYIVKRF